MHFTTITTKLSHGDDSIYRSCMPELEIEAFGATPEEATSRLQAVLEVELEHRRQLGKPIPEPRLLQGVIRADFAVDIPTEGATSVSGEIVSRPYETPAFGIKTVFA